MKKIFAAIMAAAMMATVGSTVFASTIKGFSTVTVTSSKSSEVISENYKHGMEAETADMTITSVLNELKNLEKYEKVVQTINVESVSDNLEPVKLWLNLELPAESGHSSAKDYSAVDYYSLKIENKYGNVIYDDSEAEAETGLNVKSIDLGTLNYNNKKTDQGVYKLTITPNEDVDVSQLADDPEDVVWKIVYTDDAESFKATPILAPTATAEAGQDIPVTTQNPTTGITVRVTPTPVPVKSLTYYCVSEVEKGETTKDKIRPSSYKLVGTGKAVITSKDGTKKEVELTTENKASVVELKEGDTIHVSDDQSASIKFIKHKLIVCKRSTDKQYIYPGKYNVSGNGIAQITRKATNKTEEVKLSATSKLMEFEEGDTILLTGESTYDKYSEINLKNVPTPTSKPTATPKVTATPKATATPKPTATPNVTAAPKTNPKTGDTAPVAAVSIVGISALAAVAYIGISSKKKDK